MENLPLAKAFRCIAIASMLLGAQTWAAPSTGAASLAWPLVILASPFIIVQDLIYGSDEGARKEADTKADAILAAHNEQIPVKGLYTKSLDISDALNGMLIDRRLPFIEINSAGSAWLLGQAINPQPLIDKAEQYPYIRLSLGSSVSPDCVNWASKTKEITASPPVAPGTCLLISFTDELKSDLQLDVNSSLIQKRELRWELTDRINGRTLLSVPFWNNQVTGRPLRAFAYYQDESSFNSFGRVIKKLDPQSLNLRADGRPFLLNRMSKPAPNEYLRPKRLVQGQFRESKVLRSSGTFTEKETTWEEVYERALSINSPTVMNDVLVFDPKSYAVGQACAFPSVVGSCRSAWNFATSVGLVSARESGSNEPPISNSRDMANAGQGLRLEIAIRNYEGHLVWFGDIVAPSYPDSFQECVDGKYLCLFYPKQAITTEDELIFNGSLVAAVGYGQRAPYELTVPLSKLLVISQP